MLMFSAHITNTISSAIRLHLEHLNVFWDLSNILPYTIWVTKWKKENSLCILSQLFTASYLCSVKSLPWLELKKETSIAMY